MKENAFNSRPEPQRLASSSERQNGAPGLGLSDIYYVVFRHKWKIVVISLLGLVGAAALYFAWPTPYQSEARLFVQYVVDTKNPGQMGGGNSKVTSPDERGDTVLNTELEVLSSFDLAQQVANRFGPSNILAKAGGGTNELAAAGLIRKNLILEIPKKSSVIHLVFQHPDPAVCQPVLAAIIDDYYKMHLKIHRDAGDFDDFLNQQTDQLHASLLQTEQSLREAKTNAGLVSVELTRQGYAEQMALLQNQIRTTEAELAERQAEAEELARFSQNKPVVSTNEATATNDAIVPPGKVSEYRRVCLSLETLMKREQDLMQVYTPESLSVKAVQEQMAAKEKLKSQLEAENPGLLAVRTVSAGLGPVSGPVGPPQELISQLAKVKGLQSMLHMLTNQLDQVQKSAAKFYANEGTLLDLQRTYNLQQTQYHYFSMSREQSKIDEALGPGRVSNIRKIQAPSPPARERSKVQKAALVLLVGSLGLAFGLAFVIEFYFDRSLKRPSDVENKLRLPLFMTIPQMQLNGQAKALKASRPVPLLAQRNAEPGSGDEKAGSPAGGGGAGGEKETPKSAASPDGALAPYDPRHVLRPFADALRDRLMTFFEVKNMTHKPKLVAVTSCGEGAGVSTVAAGLAASLSETGEGNVLLVDMNVRNGAAHHFFHGDVASSVNDALEAGKRGESKVQENLYVVTESGGGDSLPQALPKRFKHLVPRLKASDFDYIIFDMPPVSQVSITPRLARFMDTVLMVVESEKTDGDLVKRASALLAESQTNVGVVLNKSRSYVPRQLHQDL